MEPVTGIEPAFSDLQGQRISQRMLHRHGVDDKSRTCTALRPQRPQRCAYTRFRHIHMVRGERVSPRVCRSPHKTVRCWNWHQPSGWSLRCTSTCCTAILLSNHASAQLPGGSPPSGSYGWWESNPQALRFKRRRYANSRHTRMLDRPASYP